MLSLLNMPSPSLVVEFDRAGLTLRTHKYKGLVNTALRASALGNLSIVQSAVVKGEPVKVSGPWPWLQGAVG